jgi:hypothetical protein
MEVAADVARPQQRGRLAAERRLAQLGGTPRHAERAVDGLLVGGVRKRLELRDVRGGSRRAQQGGPEPVRRGDDELDRDAVHRHADRTALLLLEQRHDLRQGREARHDRRGIGGGAHHRKPLARVAPPARVARRRTLQRGGDAADELPRAVQQHAPRRARLDVACQRRTQARIRLRADPRHVAQPAGGRGLAQLVDAADVERARDVGGALRAQPEVAAEAHEAGRELALELHQLGDPPRLDELAQARLDAGADPGHRADPAGAHEIGHRHRSAADRLRRPAIGARRVRVRVPELQQRGERVEAVGDLGVAHRP